MGTADVVWWDLGDWNHKRLCRHIDSEGNTGES